MKGNGSIDKIFNNLDRLIDCYADLPETAEAEQKFWEYVEQDIFPGTENPKKARFENALYGLASCKEKQGFFYGFSYAATLLGTRFSP